MRSFFTIILILTCSCTSFSQSPEEVIKSIFNNALTDNTAQEHLLYLCKNTKGRIPGSQEALHAAKYTMNALAEAGAGTRKTYLRYLPSVFHHMMLRYFPDG